MSSAKSPQPSLFQVYLRLRPPISQQQDEHVERCLTVDTPEAPNPNADNGDVSKTAGPTQIVLQPPSDVRKRAVEKFGFTKVFEESASQLNVFEDTGLESIIRGVLTEGRDGLVATLGVTGSGKVGKGLKELSGQKSKTSSESHHSRIKDPKRPYSDESRCDLQVSRINDQAPRQFHQPSPSFDCFCVGSM